MSAARDVTEEESSNSQRMTQISEPRAGSHVASRKNIQTLKKGREVLGELYPILVDENGRIIDGNHRTVAGFKETKVLPWVKTPKDRIMARLWANHRRKVTESETSRAILELAVSLEREEKVAPEAVAARVVELSPFGKTLVYRYLPERFKQPAKVEAGKQTPHAKSAPLVEQKLQQPETPEAEPIQEPPRKTTKAPTLQEEATMFDTTPSKAKQPTVYEFRIEKLTVFVTIKSPYFVPRSALEIQIEHA